jgi:adenylate cyclase
MARSDAAAHPRLKAGWIPLLIGLGGFLPSPFPFSAALEEEIGLGVLYALRGPEAPSDRVVVVGIDQASALALEAPDDPHFWPRDWHAEVVRNLRAAGAEWVVFNIYFSGPAPDPSADRILAKAMREAGGVALINYLKPRQLTAGMYVESLLEPTPPLYQAAWTTAPFLLARESGSANQFLTFFGAEEERATLPTTLLLAQVLRTGYGELLALARAVDPAGLGALLEGHVQDYAQPDAFGRLRREFLARLRSRPDLAAALAAEWTARPAAGPIRTALDSLLRVLGGDRTRFYHHYGPAGRFRTFPYWRWVDSPSRETADLRGKIVLVGYLQDFQPETQEGLFHTPFSPLGSVELAATAVANLLENQEVRPVFTPLGEAFWVLAWGGLIGFLAQRLAPVRGLALVTALSGAYLAAAWGAFRLQGLWLPVVIPLFLQAPLALLGGFGSHYLRRARRERKMRSVIHRFIPVEVFSQLTQRADEANLPDFGRLTHGVCLATDAGQYTALAETTAPEELARLMNEYYKVIFEPVSRHGGWISDVIGDAMLAIWAAEGDERAARRNALAAARAIQRAVGRFEAAHGLTFPVRMGLHFGELRIGYVGTAERGEIRAVGDTVNTATRLEGLNKVLGTQILASEAVLRDLSDGGARPLGQFLLAGKTRPVPAAEIFPDPEGSPCPDDCRTRFGAALRLFAEARWPEAHAAFAALAEDHPRDGPTRFYEKTCRIYLADPPADPDAANVRVGKSSTAQAVAK